MAPEVCMVRTAAARKFGLSPKRVKEQCAAINVSRLKWGNIRFKSNLSFFEITFEIRKNSQFRQENMVLVAATKEAICPLKLLIKTQAFGC